MENRRGYGKQVCGATDFVANEPNKLWSSKVLAIGSEKCLTCSGRG